MRRSNIDSPAPRRPGLRTLWGRAKSTHEEYSALAVGTVRCESGCRHRFEGSSRLCALCGRPSRVTECALPRSPFALPSRVSRLPARDRARPDPVRARPGPSRRRARSAVRACRYRGSTATQVVRSTNTRTKSPLRRLLRSDKSRWKID